MFLFRWIRRVLFLAVFAALVWWGASYKVNGRSLVQVAKGFVGSKNFDEGVKDLKMFFGGFLKSVGEELQEDVTEEERKQLESIIRKEVREKNGNTGNKKL